jgi:hypothetical protein
MKKCDDVLFFKILKLPSLFRRGAGGFAEAGW